MRSVKRPQLVREIFEMLDLSPTFKADGYLTRYEAMELHIAISKQVVTINDLTSQIINLLKEIKHLKKEIKKND